MITIGVDYRLMCVRNAKHMLVVSQALTCITMSPAHTLAFTQDSNPKGVIRLLPTGWCRSIPQGSKRMSDAVVNKSEQTSALISVVS